MKKKKKLHKTMQQRVIDGAFSHMRKHSLKKESLYRFRKNVIVGQLDKQLIEFVVEVQGGT